MILPKEMDASELEKKVSRRDTIISVCVFLSGFSCFAQLYYFQPLLPDLARDFHLTASDSSLAVSFSTLGMVFGLITTMFIADRISRKQLISVGLLASSVFCYLYLLILVGFLRSRGFWFPSPLNRP